MMTLREFITKVNSYEHYRVYQPNRDCLIFESYFKVHSPYYFDDKHEIVDYNKDYYEDNDYCDDVYKFNKALDDETKTFLEKFGDYVIFRMECGGFKPRKIQLTDTGGLIQEVRDESMPNREYLDCFNLFIIPANVLEEGKD